MKKVSLKYIILLIGAVICLVFACLGTGFLRDKPVNSYADRSALQENVPAAQSDEEDDGDGYYFKSVNVDITVSKSKILTVREEIVAVWNVSGKRSLIRDIQRVTTTYRFIDGKEVAGKSFYMGISEIKATLDGEDCYCKLIPLTDGFYDNEYFSVEMKHKDNSFLQTGREYTFVLDYVYDMSADRVSGYDDLVYDILGYGMARTGKFAAKVSFPEGTSLENVSVRTSRTDEWSPDESRGEGWGVDGNVITVNANPGGTYAGYTLQVILPDGYFNGHVYFIWYYVVFALLFVAAVGALIFFFVRNMPKKPVETVEFYPPEGVDIMRFSAVWHRKAKDKDAAALILKWVGQGLIDIEKDGKRHFILKAQKQNCNGYDENGKPYCDTGWEKIYYKTLFSGIGGGYNKFSTRAFKKATRSEKEKLYNATQALKKSGVDEVLKPVQKARYAMPFISLVPTIVMIIYVCILTRTAFGLFFLVFMLAGTGVSAMATRPDGVPLMYIFPVAFYTLPYCIAVFTTELPTCDYAYLLYIAPFIYAAGNFVLPYLMGRRTDEAQAIYGRMRGFKRFLLTAELSRISLLFDENPEYFADILPYCLIMGVSKKVQKRFAALKNINVPVYVSQDINTVSMSHVISRSVSAGRPHTSFSGGSGSGGGHSAGGGGHGGSHGGGGGGGGSRSR